MLARRAAAGVFSRACSTLTKVKAMEASAAKMMPNMPEDLQSIAAKGADFTAQLESFAAERPELYKSVLAKIEEADKPGIRASVSEAKDPSTCKYTEEGTMVHEMMQRVAKADRRMKLMTDLEFTLTAKDKEALVADMTALAAEKNAEGASFSASDVPSSMKLAL